MKDNKLNHSELCIRAGYWLKRTFNCRFYFTDGDLLKDQKIPDWLGYYYLKNNRVVHSHGLKYSNALTPPFKSRQIDEVSFLLFGINKMKLCFPQKIDEKMKISQKIIF